MEALAPLSISQSGPRGKQSSSSGSWLVAEAAGLVARLTFPEHLTGSTPDFVLGFCPPGLARQWDYLSYSWHPRQVLSLRVRADLGAVTAKGPLHEPHNSSPPGQEPCHWMQFNVIPRTKYNVNGVLQILSTVQRLDNRHPPWSLQESIILGDEWRARHEQAHSHARNISRSPKH